MGLSGYKKQITLMAIGAVLLLIVINYAQFTELLRGVLSFLLPFGYGILLAFLANVPLRILENRFWDKWTKNAPEWVKRSKRTICMVAVYLGVAVLLTGVGFLFIPMLARSISSFIKALPTIADNITNIYYDWVLQMGIDPMKTDEFRAMLDSIASQALGFLKVILPNVLEFASDVTHGVVSFVLGIVVSIYLVATKEKMSADFWNLVRAFLPEKWWQFLEMTGQMANETFSRFVTGQVADSLLIIVVMLIGGYILRIPYPPIIAVICGLSNIIPIFGPVAGGVIAGLLVFFVEPDKALAFVIFDVVVQQVDGNLLYPRIVGDSIGVHGVWILFAVILFGGLFGLLGILLGIPFVAVALKVCDMYVRKRLKERKLEPYRGADES